MRRRDALQHAAFCLASLLVAGCGKLEGFGGAAPPLASFNVVLHSDLAPSSPGDVAGVHALRVALVWGAQWLTEPFCVLPAESPEAAAVIDAGCRDPFGFVPAAVSVSVPIEVDVPTTLTLVQLPAADVMVGDVTARVAFGSLVVFDDLDDTGTLELATPLRAPSGGRRAERPPETGRTSADIIYGASFLTMTAPDQRVAYREGEFDPGERVLPARRLRSAAARFLRARRGRLLRGGRSGGRPRGRRSRRRIRDLFGGRARRRHDVEIAARAPAEVRGGRVRRAHGRQQRPLPRAAGRTRPTWRAAMVACAHLPTFDTGAGSPASDLIQLVVSGRTFDRCKGLTHYTLRGCREDVNCPIPDWDFTASPPAWWPCGP